MEWILIPEYFIYLHRNCLFGGLPGFIPYQLMFIVFAKICNLVVALKSGSIVSFVVGQISTEAGAGFSCWLWMTFIWPIIPWFICDWIFYFNVYFFPMLIIFGLMAGIAGFGANALK